MLRRMLRFSLLLLMVLPLVFPAQVLALGIGVAPARLDFNVRPGGTEVQVLNIINPSNRELQFRVYVEGEYEEWFLITPAEFTLAPQQSKGVEIVVAPPLTASGECEFAVCVVSLPPGSDLRVGAGIKVPTQVHILEYPVALILGGVAAVLVLLVGIFIWLRRRALKRG